MVKCKWIYKTKFTSYGDVVRHKAILVAKGFSRQEGIEYTKMFTLVAIMNSIWIVLSLTASFGWEVHQMDMKCSLLHQISFKRFVWSSHMVFCKIKILYAYWRSLCMAKNNHLGHGMGRKIIYFSILISNVWIIS